MSKSPDAPAPPRHPHPTYDPIRLCVYTTIGLLAWLLTPPLVVAYFAGLGLWGYGRAWRAGLRTSKCILRDARLVLAYLGAAFAAGAFFGIRNLLELL